MSDQAETIPHAEHDESDRDDAFDQPSGIPLDRFWALLDPLDS